MFRDAVLTSKAIETARRLGMSGTMVEIEAELHRMARLSAPFTHPIMNRRYGDWVFQVTNDRVLHIGRVLSEGSELRDRPAFDILCEDCWADGGHCHTCLGDGFIRKPIVAITEKDLIFKV